ncbi:cation efflux family protein [Polychaeton citri CBS 116435]|uniref:Cation efflux family protein n=1 Tax=Polychaeton citri CBS 116435 TaxID=1314669 RepID=A0A9P4QBU2_9PEZI|nr:cation efflux family protein [Polychaeton citri CBS 116435]
MVGKRGFANDRPSSFNTHSYSNGNIRDSVNRHRHANGDVERGYDPARSGRPRPNLFRFRDAAKTALEDARRDELKKTLLTGIDRNALEKFRKSDEELKSIKNKGVRKFYEAQNERLNDWLEVDATVMAIADDVLESMDPDPDHDGDQERGGGIQQVKGNIGQLLPEEERRKRAADQKKAKWAINTNVIANIILLIGKIVAAFTTGSLSLIASLVDSALDLLCTLIVWSTNKLVQWHLNALQKKFPVGRRRLEPLGILVFSIIMVISFLQILQESVEKIMPLHGKAEMLSGSAIGALVATVVIKGVIGVGCLPIKTTQVQALVQDCKTDVIFNTLSLLFPVIGAAADVWWLDPVGAGLLSIYIIYDWAHTCFENITRLSGETASDHTQKKLMYLAYRFSPVVKGFKSITAYHAGDGVWVEFDVLLEPNTMLCRSHDIAETLQYCAEGLDEVDRAFVTTDYDASGPTGHAEDAETNS